MPNEPLQTGNAATSENLRSFIERIENLEEDKTQVAADIREVYAEAKGYGLDPKIMRQVIKLRSMDKQTLQTHDAMLETYRAALGLD